MASRRQPTRAELYPPRNPNPSIREWATALCLSPEVGDWNTPDYWEEPPFCAQMVAELAAAKALILAEPALATVEIAVCSVATRMRWYVIARVCAYEEGIGGRALGYRQPGSGYGDDPPRATFLKGE